MLTNNYYNMVRMAMLNSNLSTGGLVNNVRISDTTYVYPGYIQPYDNLRWIRINTSSNESGGWSFGTGNTAPTVDDYKMDSFIQSLSSVLNTNAVVSGYESDTEYGVRITLTCTNISNSDFTFREIGYRGEIKGSLTPASSISSYYALFYRHVFDADITIQPTETKVLIIILKFPK